MIWPARLCLSLIVLGWSFALFKSLRAIKRKKWELGPDSNPADETVSVSIVIPARNEERGIQRCILSAREQDHSSLQIVVFDDASTDNTSPIITRQASNDERVVALTGDGAPLPEGWFGKPWALQRAQSEAHGDWLLFIDADVELHPSAASRTLGYALDNELDMVTGLGEMEMHTFWEKVLQPAVGGLILAGNSLTAVNDPKQKDINLANGQFILISRIAYDKIGRHTVVKNNILDDVGIARAVAEAGLLYHCLHLSELFRCRMYTNFSEIWEGWTKNIFAGLRYSVPNVLLAVLFTFSFSIFGHLLFVLGAFQLISLELMLWGTAIMCLCQLVRLVMDLRRGMDVSYGLTHAPASIMVVGIIIHSAIRSLRGTVTWKGRTYKPHE
jgi:chlorobactene glucosyltransferase